MTFLPLSLVNGLIYPLSTIWLLSVYIVGRYLFTQGYLEKDGAWDKNRLLGSVLVNTAKMLMFGLTFVGGFQMARGKLILQKALQL